jgi:CRP-like cAMP-binding protein
MTESRHRQTDFPLPPSRRRRSSCLSCPAFAETIWEALPIEDARWLDAAKVTHHFPRGADLMAESEPAAGVWCVGAGLVCVRRRNTEGASVPLRLHHAGAVLGLRAFVMGSPFQVSAEVLRPSRICFIAAETVRSLLSRNLNLALRMVRGLVEELSVLEQRLMAVRPIDPRARLAALLLELAEDLGVRTPRGSLVVGSSLRLADCAAALGMPVATAKSTLADLVAAGIVAVGRRRLEILQLDRLRAVARPLPSIAPNGAS